MKTQICFPITLDDESSESNHFFARLGTADPCWLGERISSPPLFRHVDEVDLAAFHAAAQVSLKLTKEVLLLYPIFLVVRLTTLVYCSKKELTATRHVPR